MISYIHLICYLIFDAFKTYLCMVGMVKFYLTNKLKYIVSNANIDYCMATCRETAHRIRRVFAVMQPQ